MKEGTSHSRRLSGDGSSVFCGLGRFLEDVLMLLCHSRENRLMEVRRFVWRIPFKSPLDKAAFARFHEKKNRLVNKIHADFLRAVGPFQLEL